MESDLLDIVIGVVFVWLLLSMVLSAVNEGLALLTRVRAKHLWLGIGRLFDPAATPLPRRLLDVSVRLPFRAALDLRPRAIGAAATDTRSRKFGAWVDKQWTAWRADKLSENALAVRANNECVYEALAPALTEVALPGRLSKVTHVATEAFSEAVLRVACNVHVADLAAAAKECDWTVPRRTWLTKALAATPVEQPLKLEDVIALADGDAGLESDLRRVYRQAANHLSGRDVADLFANNPDLVKAVKEAAAAVGTDERVVAVRKAVESWFEVTMDQLSTFYRRQSRKVLGLLAIPLVLFTQANSIAIFEELRKDTSLRQAVVAAAGGTVDAGITAVCAPPADTSPTSQPVSTTTSTTAAPDPVAAASERLHCARDVLDRATEFRVGLAWQELKEAHGATGKEAEPELADLVPYVGHALGEDWGLAGRTITLLALMFGAQFWFDELRRLVGVRKALAGAGAGSGGAGGGGGGTTAG